MGALSGNKLGAAVGQVGHYHRYLRTILSRYHSVARAYGSASQLHIAALAKGDHHAAREYERKTRRWHYVLLFDIESFFLFAKIMLDRCAHLIEYYFGQTRGSALDSHHDLVGALPKVAETKGLTLPPRIMQIARQLKSDVSDVRDYQISHEKSPRTMRILSTREGRVRMIQSRLFPREKDVQKEFPYVDEAFVLIDDYLGQLAELLNKNKSKTVLG